MRNEWYQHASEIACKIPHDPTESNSAYLGYIKGIEEMQKALIECTNDEIASLQREHDRTDNLQYQCGLYQQISALKFLLLKFDNAIPNITHNDPTNF